MKTILVLTDFSKKSEHAAECALLIAKRVKADILLFNAFHVNESKPDPQKYVWVLEEFFCQEDESKKQLNELANKLKQKTEDSSDEYKPEINCMTRAGVLGKLGENIKEIIEEKEIWMIIMGSKGDECLSNFIFGTNAYSVITRSSCPILFIPTKAPVKAIEKIAIVSDLKSSDLSQIQFLSELKNAFNLEIIIAHISLTSPVRDYQNSGVKEEALEYSSTTGYKPMVLKDIKGNQIPDQTQEFALKSRIDILGIVHHKEDVFHRMFHSSTTDLLVDNPLLSLLVLPESSEQLD